MKKFSINKPKDDNGIFVLILKYVTLFIVTWIAVMLFGIFIKGMKRGVSDIISNNIEIISLFVAGAIVFYFAKSIYNKYKMGSLFEIIFNDKNEELRLKVVNVLNDKVKEKIVKYENLKVQPEIKSNGLTGKQRIINIYDQKEPINKLNIELTGWCRHEEIDEIIENFKKFSV